MSVDGVAKEGFLVGKEDAEADTQQDREGGMEGNTRRNGEMEDG